MLPLPFMILIWVLRAGWLVYNLPAATKAKIRAWAQRGVTNQPVSRSDASASPEDGPE